MRRIRAFTLVEILIVVIILGALSALALVNYNKSIRQSNEREAVNQLMTIYTANEVFHKRTGQYLATGTLAQVNTGLGLSIVAGQFNYNYVRSGVGSATTYQATAAYTGSPTFTVRIINGDITNLNPCCSSALGSCPSVPSC